MYNCTNKHNESNSFLKGLNFYVGIPTMTKTTFSILDKVIIYIISKLPSGITRTQLVKLLYLIDLTSFQQQGNSLTNLKYVSYYYGPYSSQIVGAINSLNNFEIQEELNTTFDGNTFFLYSLGTNFRLKDNLNEILSSQENKIVDQVIDKYGNKSLESLLKIVYETEAYKKTPLGKEISFA